MLSFIRLFCLPTFHQPEQVSYVNKWRFLKE
ncbi:hypothetical protein EHW99_3434 [Erwinia amylovora]|uniref:Uncharacterized protein n=3 Tax=Erwinia amylovora TaxID=552 RepID=A0A831ELK6_ERWAM|nr:hypothetical protein EaACW_3506 [Erwinia amylovora ACW56400]QJQ56133.1 hypothetical protein EHX00_3434 [Erwinia amylovora]CBA23745.1 hypothetical protein predicted by Glimmer/Critica [Erwinia amylovora CFBP1430]CBX82365.1 hypothetical protein predicted by Glimmer/Critica [Erwinia amylovora ATCC BAA-2158]CCO80344.1 hypothetical protein BN432_3576 [Erwinia amylovora Ea356]CCO84150.1 hypothetical protein BN433_3605 [Erwinia amylovora Ea266]CCO87909.1 hypothetical protein BN434_3551 [Erwinia a